MLHLIRGASASRQASSAADLRRIPEFDENSGFDHRKREEPPTDAVNRAVVGEGAGERSPGAAPEAERAVQEDEAANPLAQQLPRKFFRRRHPCQVVEEQLHDIGLLGVDLLNLGTSQPDRCEVALEPLRTPLLGIFTYGHVRAIPPGLFPLILNGLRYGLKAHDTVLGESDDNIDDVGP